MGRKKKITGLGDIVAKVTTAIGIQPCKDCEERQKKWNFAFPRGLKPREMTEQELNDWKEFKDSVPTLDLSNKERLFLCKTYSDVFQVPYYEPCVNCRPKPYMIMVDRMDKIVDTYFE